MGISQIKLGKNAANKTIRVGIVGFERQSRAAINLFFLQQGQQYTLVPLEQAEVLIVDMEHPEVAPVIEQYGNVRPLVAVTATENKFAGTVTLRKPLQGKRLVNAIIQASDNFVSNVSDEKELPESVSNGGEKAFQEYQKRVAAGRQAMSDYQKNSSTRDRLSSNVRQRFMLDDVTQVSSSNAAKASIVETDATSKPVVDSKDKPDSNTDAASVSDKVESVVAVPLEQKAAVKRPQEIKAKLSY